MNLVAVSGGFDPLHVGHLALFRQAAQYGEVMVILNSDDWLKRKKGYVFMPWEQRQEILQAIEHVSCVVDVDDSDDTVCEALRRERPDFFANGGDRVRDNTPEAELCSILDIAMIFQVGGDKVESSSKLVNDARASLS